MTENANGSQLRSPDGRVPHMSAHVCPQCQFAINLKDIGLREGATGLISCPKCDWSGPVEIQIVDRESTD